MKELAAALEDALAAPAPQQRPDDPKARKRVIWSLFRLFQSEDVGLARLYYDETQFIPLDKLAAACRAIVRSRKWRGVPQVGEIVEAARFAAGMHREQYDAGRGYIPAATDWPPEGRRHAVQRGEFERLPELVELPDALGPGGEIARLGSGDAA